MHMDEFTSGLLRWATTHPTGRQVKAEIPKGGPPRGQGGEDPLLVDYHVSS